MRLPTYTSLFCLAFLLCGCQGSSLTPSATTPTGPTDGTNQPNDETTDPVKSICSDAPDAISNCARYTKALFESLATHFYLTAESEKVNQVSAFISEATSNKYINIYINKEDKEAYSQIDPDIEFSGIEVSEGATIIREIWSTDNRLEYYTVMTKMEKGYFPEGGDFSYSVIKHDGTVEQGGKLESCADCHRTREYDGFLFGVRQSLKRGNEDIDSHLNAIAKKVVSDKIYLDKNQFFPMNDTPYPSELNSQNYLKLYISQFGSLNYLTVHRDRENSNAQLPQETVIIREVKDVVGNLKTITVMVKGPKGYYPEGGDFYYGVFDPGGNVIVENGEKQAGRLQKCGSCHNSLRSNDGFLFGVSSDNRR